MVRIDIIGLDQFKSRMEKASREVQARVAYEIGAAAANFEALAIRNLVAQGGDTGTMARSIGKKQVTTFHWDVFVGAEYAPFIEFGTKGKYSPYPGTEQIAAQFKGKRIRSAKSFYQAIYDWVKRKGLVAQYSVKTRKRTKFNQDEAKRTEQAAFLIMRSISRNGISPKPFFYRNITPVRQQLERRIKIALNGI